MLIFFDLIISMLLIIIVIMILCGFFSLCESNWLALFQLRIGPGIFLFGLLCPITDGINLFINFCLFVISIDIFYFLSGCFILFICMYIIWFIIPLGFLIFINISLDLFLLLLIHLLGSIFGIYMIGCFILCSAFVYLASISIIFFSMMSEICLILIFYCIFLLDSSNLMSLNEIALGQLYINNFYYLNFFFFFIILISITLDSFNLPFDYAECESELVAGIVTEFSGIFFVLYSLYEINHVILNALLVITLCFGGFFMSINVLIFIIIFFIIPSAIFLRIRVTTAYTFIITYLYTLLSLYLIWFFLINILLYIYI